MKIINIKEKDDPLGIYVGRGSPLGNPFPIGPEGTREEVIEKYRVWLMDQIRRKNPVVLTALKMLNESSVLKCFCVPASCHAEVIRDVWRAHIKGQIPARNLAYAGIGSRKTPENVCAHMTKIAARLAALGYTLYSGKATGADTAFEKGAEAKKIFVPYVGFNHSDSSLVPSREAFQIAEYLHPAWKALDSAGRALMARNSHQVLGEDLVEPVDFVVCWTKDGCESHKNRRRSSGGTGQAISLASIWGVPVFNLKNPDAIQRLGEWVRSHPELSPRYPVSSPRMS